MFSSFLLRYWYHIGACVGLVAFIALGIFWQDLSTLQALLLANFGVMCLHWFEEFGFPGGFPYFCNAIRMGSSADKVSYFPLNRRSAIAINYTFGFVYFLAFCFPNAIWLALGTALFGILECLVHGIYNNLKLKGFFNAGMITAFCGFLPIAIGIISYVLANHLASFFDWILAFMYPVLLYLFFLKYVMPIALVDNSGKYAFSEAEMQRFFAVHKHFKNQ